MRIGVRISEFFMHAWVIFLNKYLCMLIMIPGECTDPLKYLGQTICINLLKYNVTSEPIKKILYLNQIFKNIISLTDARRGGLLF